jgi:hypothetical protein
MRLWCRALLVLLIGGCGDDGSGGSTSGEETTSGDPMTSTGSESSTGDPTTSSEGSSSSSSSASSSSEGSSGSDGSASSGSGGEALSFETDVWPLLELERDPPLSGEITTCNGCHATGAGGLTMPDPASAHETLLGTTSSSVLCAGTTYVVAGDPDNSCFVLFYEMRLRDQLGWVDQAETDIVRAWVESGAAP